MHDVAKEGLEGEAERSSTSDFVDFTRFAQRRFDDVAVVIVKLMEDDKILIIVIDRSNAIDSMLMRK